MKKLILISALALGLSAQARTTLDVRGAAYTVDTVYHALVGPGTTQTQLRLNGAPGPLDVFYLTVDKSYPGVSIRTVCATDKVAGNERTSAMAQRKSTGNLTYFAGTNGDFYSTSGTATNGTSVVGTPTTSTIVDREIYKTSNSNYQFSVDTEGVARVCRLNYYTGTATIGAKTTLFKGVNVSSPNNGITLYTPRYWGSANQGDYAGSCHQVSARLADGSEPFYAGGKFKLVVTSEPATGGDMVIPNDGYVIHGRGTSTSGCNTGADDFVAALKPGDIVEFDNIILTPENIAIQPTCVISGNPKNVGAGETLESEGERGDAPARHPRTGIGVSEDGNKIIMMVIDGRTASSIGVATGMLGDVMRFAGAYEALNLDGGGSSTLYTQALGVRNHCSDGNERAVGNGVFAVLDAPEDNEIAAISIEDWAVTMPFYGLYTPVVYGFNKYGKCISTDVKGFTVSSPAGDAVNDGTTLLAKQTGTYALTVTYNGATASLPVTVNEPTGITAKYPAVVLNTTREWSIDLQSVNNGEAMTVSPEPFNWTSSDADIATVSEDGVVKGVSDGQATITGTLGDNTVAIVVNVQTPSSVIMPIERTGTVDPWTITATSVTKGFTTSVLENGLNIDFTLSSTRSPKITAKLAGAIWSLPEGLQLRINSGDITVSRVITTVKAANADRTTQIIHETALDANTLTTLKYKFADYFDLSDIGVFPITLQSLDIYLKGATKTDYHLQIPGIEAVYDENTLGVDEITADSVANPEPKQWYNLQGIPVSDTTAPGIYIAPGHKKLVK